MRNLPVPFVQSPFLITGASRKLTVFRSPPQYLKLKLSRWKLATNQTNAKHASAAPVL